MIINGLSIEICTNYHSTRTTLLYSCGIHLQLLQPHLSTLFQKHCHKNSDSWSGPSGRLSNYPHRYGECEELRFEGNLRGGPWAPLTLRLPVPHFCSAVIRCISEGMSSCEVRRADNDYLLMGSTQLLVPMFA